MKRMIVVLVSVIFLILANNGKAAINPFWEPECLESSVLCQKFFVVFWSGIGILVEKFGNPAGNYSVEIKEEAIEKRDEKNTSLRLGIVVRVKEGKSDFIKIIIVGFGSGDEEEENKKNLKRGGSSEYEGLF